MLFLIVNFLQLPQVNLFGISINSFTADCPFPFSHDHIPETRPFLHDGQGEDVQCKFNIATAAGR